MTGEREGREAALCGGVIVVTFKVCDEECSGGSELQARGVRAIYRAHLLGCFLASYLKLVKSGWCVGRGVRGTAGA